MSRARNKPVDQLSNEELVSAVESEILGCLGVDNLDTEFPLSVPASAVILVLDLVADRVGYGWDVKFIPESIARSGASRRGVYSCMILDHYANSPEVWVAVFRAALSVWRGRRLGRRATAKGGAP